MKRILLPTDFSENSKSAMDYAMNFFAGTSCTFYVLNVQKYSEYISDDLMSAAPGASVHDAIAMDNKAQLFELVSNYRTKFKKEHFEFEALFDFDVFIDSITQTLELHKIDMIVMGTNGVSGAKEAIFGSNTLQVIRNVECPVLAVPENYTFNKIESVLYSMEKDRLPGVDTQELMTGLLEGYKPMIHLLSLREEDVADPSEIKGDSVFSDLKVAFHSLSGMPYPMAIKAFVSIMKVDLHVICVEKQSFLNRFFYGSNTSKVSYNTIVPLLVLKS